MNFNARPKDAEIYSVLLEGLSPVGFRPLPGGRKFFRDTRELTIIAELEKGRPSSDGTYRDVILGYFVRGTRNPMGPAFVYSQVYAHVLRAKNLEGRELYNIREPSEHRLLLRDIIELSVPFAAECDNWSSIYYGILEGSVPTLQSMFTEPNPPAAIRDAAEVAVACGNSEWLRDCRARLRDSDWGDEGNEFACMVLEDLPSSLG